MALVLPEISVMKSVAVLAVPPWAWTSAPGEEESRLIMGEHLVTFDPGLVLLDVIGR